MIVDTIPYINSYNKYDSIRKTGKKAELIAGDFGNGIIDNPDGKGKDQSIFIGPDADFSNSDIFYPGSTSIKSRMEGTYGKGYWGLSRLSTGTTITISDLENFGKPGSIDSIDKLVTREILQVFDRYGIDIQSTANALKKAKSWEDLTKTFGVGLGKSISDVLFREGWDIYMKYAQASYYLFLKQKKRKAGEGHHDIDFLNMTKNEVNLYRRTLYVPAVSKTGGKGEMGVGLVVAPLEKIDFEALKNGEYPMSFEGDF